MASDSRRKLRNQMNYVGGQAQGIVKMLDAGAADAEVVIQLRAMRAGIDRALRLAVEAGARERLVRELEAKVLACPGLCDYCDDLNAIIAELDLGDLVQAVAV